MAAPRIAVLHQGCVPTYRRAFFDRLGRITSREYIVFHGEAEPGSGVVAASPPFSFTNVRVHNRFLRFLGRTLVYQPVLRPIMAGDFDALVIGHEVKYLANLLLLLQFRLRGKPVLLWGFGRNLDIDAKSRSCLGARVGRLIAHLQRGMMFAATDFMAYTDSGAEHAAAAGMGRERIAVLNNTIDISEEIAAHARAQAVDRRMLRQKFGIAPESVVLLYVGRLTSGKKVDRLVEAARAVRSRHGAPVEVVVVGGGPEEARLIALAGGEGWCHFLGPIHATEPLSRLFRISDALVIPGYVGLAVNHAFAHGVPVITCQSDVHSPEIDYVVHDQNGLIVASLEDLGEGIRGFAQSPDLRTRLAAGALATREKLDLQRMVEAFDGGVARAIARSMSPRGGDAKARTA
jgi:glycosyltransferase involved in cell wall biosynthesis